VHGITLSEKMFAIEENLYFIEKHYNIKTQLILTTKRRIFIMKNKEVVKFYTSSNKVSSKKKSGVAVKVGRCCTCVVKDPPK